MQNRQHTPISSHNACFNADALSLPADVLDHTLAFAYDFMAARRYEDAARLCQSILVADPYYWWCYSLYAAVLQRQGKHREALVMIQQSLRYEPAQPKLLAAKADLETALSNGPAAKAKRRTAPLSSRSTQTSVLMNAA